MLFRSLLDHDINYILEEGLSQQKAGADILDVNVGLPEIDEPSMMKEVVSELQAVSDLPLQIDTGDEKALESALRIYNGKPMINSVNGRKDIQDKVFPLAKKYGGLIVGLTIGEAGVPETVEERVEIARKIYERAAEYGIEKKNTACRALAGGILFFLNVILITTRAGRLPARASVCQWKGPWRPACNGRFHHQWKRGPHRPSFPGCPGALPAILGSAPARRRTCP